MNGRRRAHCARASPSSSPPSGVLAPAHSTTVHLRLLAYPPRLATLHSAAPGTPCPPSFRATHFPLLPLGLGSSGLGLGTPGWVTGQAGRLHSLRSVGPGTFPPAPAHSRGVGRLDVAGQPASEAPDLPALVLKEPPFLQTWDGWRRVAPVCGGSVSCFFLGAVGLAWCLSLPCPGDYFSIQCPRRHLASPPILPPMFPA